MKISNQTNPCCIMEWWPCLRIMDVNVLTNNIRLHNRCYDEIRLGVVMPRPKDQDKAWWNNFFLKQLIIPPRIRQLLITFSLQYAHKYRKEQYNTKDQLYNDLTNIHKVAPIEDLLSWDKLIVIHIRERTMPLRQSLTNPQIMFS